MAKIKVLQVDQWTSTAKNIKDFTLEDFEPRNLRKTLSLLCGGDAKAIQKIGIANATIREVEENSRPPIAHVWFITGPDGKLRFFKANYDCSD